MRIDDLSQASPKATVATVAAKSPAEEMGLQPGDQILEINGEPVTPDQIPEVTLRAKSATVELTVERDGERIRLEPVKPRAKSGVRHLGFTLEDGGDTPVVWRQHVENGELTGRLERFLSGAGTVMGVRG